MKPKNIRDITIGEVLDAFAIITEAQKALSHAPILPQNIIVNTPVQIKLQEKDETISEAVRKILEEPKPEPPGGFV